MVVKTPKMSSSPVKAVLPEIAVNASKSAMPPIAR
jgi:hypothetical protein